MSVTVETQRSMSGLRETLFSALDDLRSGKIDEKQAKSVAQLSQTILNTVSVQVEYEKLRIASEVPKILPAMDLIPKLADASKD